jgi:hypothetical protein
MLPTAFPKFGAICARRYYKIGQSEDASNDSLHFFVSPVPQTDSIEFHRILLLDRRTFSAFGVGRHVKLILHRNGVLIFASGHLD